MRSLFGFKKTWLCVIAVLGLGVVTVLAGTAKLKLTLVWGTDEEKPNDAKLKALDPQMAAQFREFSKWKYYFEVTNTMATISQNATNRVRLSPKCELEVENLGKDGLAAKFFGEGKLIYKGKSQVEIGKHWGFGATDKGETAWFVILSPQP